jgi:S-methylmethionine-dependent homocysteine/selenocysteine methylase
VTNRVETIIQKLTNNQPVLLDGAFGTELARRGVQTTLPLWSGRAILSAPDICQQIHQEYIGAGADIITTNTFRTNPRICQQHPDLPNCETLTSLACTQAHTARVATGRPDIVIAGCIAPVEDCYQPDLVPSDRELKEEHFALAAALGENHVDLILCETMNCIREAEHALDAASSTGLPVAVSFVCSPDGNLLSGETLEAACETVAGFDPIFVSLNCAPAHLIYYSLKKLREATDLPLGIYANGIGRPDEGTGWIFPEIGTPVTEYCKHAKEWLEMGALILGGCCGTTPEYISGLQEIISTHFKENSE